MQSSPSNLSRGFSATATCSPSSLRPFAAVAVSHVNGVSPRSSPPCTPLSSSGCSGSQSAACASPVYHSVAVTASRLGAATNTSCLAADTAHVLDMVSPVRSHRRSISTHSVATDGNGLTCHVNLSPAHSPRRNANDHHGIHMSRGRRMSVITYAAPDDLAGLHANDSPHSSPTQQNNNNSFGPSLSGNVQQPSQRTESRRRSDSPTGTVLQQAPAAQHAQHASQVPQQAPRAPQGGSTGAAPLQANNITPLPASTNWGLGNVFGLFSRGNEHAKPGVMDNDLNNSLDHTMQQHANPNQTQVQASQQAVQQEAGQDAAVRDTRQLMTYLGSNDPDMVQGALAIIVDYLRTQRLTASDLLEAGLLPRLVLLIQPMSIMSATSCLALEALSELLIVDPKKPIPAETANTASAAVRHVNYVLHRCLEPWISRNGAGSHAVVQPPSPPNVFSSRAAHHQNELRRTRSSSPEVSRGRTPEESSLHGVSRYRSMAPSPTPDIRGSTAAAPATLSQLVGTYSTPGSLERSYQRLPNDIRTPPPDWLVQEICLTGNVILRMARIPSAAKALCDDGALECLSAGLLVPDDRVKQVCLLALRDLVRSGSHADNLLKVLDKGALPNLVNILNQLSNEHVKHEVAVSSDENGPMSLQLQMCKEMLERYQSACKPQPETPVVQENNNALNTRNSIRHLGGNLLLDLALLPSAADIAIDTGIIKTLVQYLGPGTDSELRMTMLLVLARLASKSMAVQLDTVREGAVPLLVARMLTGSEQDQMHACRLAAILAQSAPTHQALTAPAVMETLTMMLRSTSPLVVEHACSWVAVLAGNPDTHYKMVESGVVPLLVTHLTPTWPANFSTQLKGTISKVKTHTYALCTMMLLAQQEARHADVISRAGALPHLIQLVRPSKEEATRGVHEYACATISCLSKIKVLQEELISAGSLPALIDLLKNGHPVAQGHAAESLLYVAACEQHKGRLIIRASEILPTLASLPCSKTPTARYYGTALLHFLCQNDAVLQEVQQMPEVLASIVAVLQNQQAAQPADCWKAQAQACWILARMCEDVESAKKVAAAGVIRPLVRMLSYGWESVQNGTGGALHLHFQPNNGHHPQAGDKPLSRRHFIENLDTNGHAAAAAALLALAGALPHTRDDMKKEMLFHEAWRGKPARLDALFI